MTIKLEFENYDEMTSFCRQLLAKEEIATKVPVTVEEIPVVAEETAEEPTPAKEETYTIPEVRAFLGALRKDGKKEAVSALIAEMGYEKFTQVPEEKFPELMEKARKL